MRKEDIITRPEKHLEEPSGRGGGERSGRSPGGAAFALISDRGGSKVDGKQPALTLASGRLPRASELFTAFDDPLCVTPRHATDMGGPTAELAMLLHKHGMPQKLTLPGKAYAEVGRLLAAGADPCRDLRVFPEDARVAAVAATARLKAARDSGASVPETSHVTAILGGGKRPASVGVSCALAIALRCGDERLLALLTTARGEDALPLRPNALYVVDTGSFMSVLTLAFAGPVATVGRMVAAALAMGADPNAPVAFLHGDAQVAFATGTRGKDGVAALLPQFVDAGLRVVRPLSLVTAVHNNRSLPSAQVEAVTRALVAAGAHVDAFDYLGRSPLMAEIYKLMSIGPRQDAEVEAAVQNIEVLLELGADPNLSAVAPSLAARPLDMFSARPESALIKSPLLRRVLAALKCAGADFRPLVFHMGAEAVGTVATTDFLSAGIMNSNLELLRFAVKEGGVSPSARNALASKSTLLHTACLMGDSSIVDMLLEAGSALAYASYAMPWIYWQSQVVAGALLTANCVVVSSAAADVNSKQLCDGGQLLIAGVYIVSLGAFFSAVAALVMGIVACRVHRVKAFTSLKPGGCCGNVPAGAGLGWTGTLLTFIGMIIGWSGFNKVAAVNAVPSPPGGAAAAIAFILTIIGAGLSTGVACTLGALPGINGASPCGCCPAMGDVSVPVYGGVTVVAAAGGANVVVMRSPPDGSKVY